MMPKDKRVGKEFFTGNQASGLLLLKLPTIQKVFLENAEYCQKCEKKRPFNSGAAFKWKITLQTVLSRRFHGKITMPKITNKSI